MNTILACTTYSMWRLFRNCRKAFWWRYIQKLVPIQRDHTLRFGTVIHECLEIWHQQRQFEKVSDHINQIYANRAQNSDQLRSWHLATAMMKGYAARYPTEKFNVKHVEKKFEGKIINPLTGASSRSFLLAGVIDAIVYFDGLFYILEHKTASQIDAAYIERLWTDFQIILYAWYAEQALGIKISGIIYNILVKARLKQSPGETEAEYEARKADLIAKSKTGKTSAKRKMPETDEAFQARLATKYAEPGMFHREQILISRDQFESLQTELWELTQSLLEAQRRGIFYQNTAFCFIYGRPCSYYPLCSSNSNPNIIENLYEKKEPNEELNAGNSISGKSF